MVASESLAALAARCWTALQSVLIFAAPTADEGSRSQVPARTAHGPQGSGGGKESSLIGIDVAKASLSAALVDPTTRRLVWERVYPHTPAGIRSLLEHTPCEMPWVLEPTGRYSLAVAQQGRAAHRTVLLAPARRAKAFLASIQSRAKTDRVDSRGLALYGLSVPLRPYPIKSESVEHLDQLLAARRGLSQALMSLTQQQAALPYAVAALQPAVAALKAQRQALDSRIAALTAQGEEFSLVSALAGVPGIGPVTAAAVASCLRHKVFAHPDAFVAHIGLDVRIHASGKRKGQRGLSKQGDPELRRLLFLCARATLLAKVSPFKAQYERELAKGLSKTAALCAIARKMARMCWSMARHGTSFDADRVYRHPSPPKPGVTP